MAGWLIIAVGVAYLAVAADLYFSQGKVGLAITFFGYALSNVGLYMAAK